MNILAVSYYNIGPFAEQKISLCFNHRNVLIQGPIGTGKSFLFFDGILYGLYRSKESRKVLNLHAKNGYIKLCLVVDGMILFIIRHLKFSKTNSCSSELYKIDADIEQVQSLLYHSLGKTLTQETDIGSILQQFPSQLINFKNETDLQQHIDQLIGNINVLKYTNFLVQDSGNIFTETKTERINLLKQIFQLTAIDHAKDLLVEHRYELNALQKIKGDSRVLFTKYEKIQTQLIHLLPDLEKMSGIDSIIINIHRLCGSSLEYAGVESEILSLLENQKNSLTYSLHIYTNLCQDKKRLEGQIISIQADINSYTTQLDHLEIDKKNIADRLFARDESILQTHLVQSQDCLIQLQTLQNETDIHFLQVQDPQVQTLSQADRLIHDLIYQGKQGIEQISHIQSLIQGLQAQMQTWQTRIQSLQSKLFPDYQDPTIVHILSQYRDRLKHDRVLIDQSILHYDQQSTQYHTQILELAGQITKLHTILEQKSDFFCSKIEGHCPFISTINESALKPLSMQIQILEQQQSVLKNALQDLEGQYKEKDYDSRKKLIQDQLLHIDTHPQEYIGDYIQDIQQQIATLTYQLDQQDMVSKIQGYQTQILTIQTQNEKIKKILTDSDYKFIQDQYKLSCQLTTQYDAIQQKIQLLQSEKLKLSTYQEDLQNKKVQIATIQGQIGQMQSQCAQLKIELHDLHETLALQNKSQIESDFNHLDLTSKLLQEMHHLITEHKHNQGEVIHLKQQLEYVNNLHQIFAKDLFLIVLQEILPLVTDILNQLLMMVVSYEVLIDVININSERLELEATVRDEYGIRPIDSLSGGQKTILKLVWILAVSIYLQVEFIFLDETINNLDVDTVSKVAQLLSDYVKKNNIKLHIITHSQQIQEMNIRDEVVDLTSLRSQDM